MTKCLNQIIHRVVFPYMLYINMQNNQFYLHNKGMNSSNHLSQALLTDNIIHNKKQTNMSIAPLQLKRIIFKKKSTNNKDGCFGPQTSKVGFLNKRNQRYQTLPKIYIPLSQSGISSPQNIYESLNISTNSWCLYDSKRNKYLGFRQNYRRQVASLTKIMTALISISFLEQNSYPLTTYIKVTKTAAEMIGTSANLKEGVWINFQDLLYGTMLPSGNDAAYSLAQYIGYLMLLKPLKVHKKMLDLSKQNTNPYVQQFVSNMNRKAETLDLTNTKYSNPHGLQNALNTSSAKDIVKLSQQASKNNLFSVIMNTRYYKYYFFKGDDLQQSFLMRWWNTNKLLAKQWQGIKTGQTNSAGSCLSSLKEGIFITVLKCSNTETRFTDTQRIFNWYLNHIGQTAQTKCNSSLDVIKLQKTLTQSSL